MLSERAYEFRLVGVFPPKTVTVNGQPLTFVTEEGKPGWRYDGNQTTVIITTPRFKVSDRVSLAAELPQTTDSQNAALNGLPGHISRLRFAMDTLNGTWRQGWAPDSLIHEFEVGDRMTYYPDRALQEVDDFQSAWPKMIDDVLSMQKDGIDAAAIDSALSHLGVKVTMSAAHQ